MGREGSWKTGRPVNSGWWGALGPARVGRVDMHVGACGMTCGPAPPVALPNHPQAYTPAAHLASQAAHSHPAHLTPAAPLRSPAAASPSHPAGAPPLPAPGCRWATARGQRACAGAVADAVHRCLIHRALGHAAARPRAPCTARTNAWCNAMDLMHASDTSSPGSRSRTPTCALRGTRVQHALLSVGCTHVRRRQWPTCALRMLCTKRWMHALGPPEPWAMHTSAPHSVGRAHGHTCTYSHARAPEGRLPPHKRPLNVTDVHIVVGDLGLAALGQRGGGAINVVHLCSGV